MRTIYRLSDCHQFIADVQRATLTTEDCGYEPWFGLFGSEEWWAAVYSGKLEMHKLKGTITRTNFGGHADWNEFEVTTTEGEQSHWPRLVNEPNLDGYYTVGRAAELDYVHQHWREKSRSLGAEAKVIIEIRVGDVA